VRVLRTKAQLRETLLPARGQARSVGLVPTMGALHDGHVALLGAARARCDVVVMSLFVNPAQFAAGEDLASYPRDEERDLALARAAGVDFVFAPNVEEVYPDGFATTVAVGGGLADVLCGDPSRRGRGHFDGVVTVVAKLFNIVEPDVAFFGRKDAQQALIVRRMARDLDVPVEIETVETVREPGGLAISSRNAYLSGAERERAAALSRALRTAQEAVRGEGASLDEALSRAREQLSAAGIEPEYLEARDAEDLTPAADLDGRPVLVAVAARVGPARLIDNVIIEPESG